MINRRHWIALCHEGADRILLPYLGSGKVSKLTSLGQASKTLTT